jgi:hypothetical protein
MAASPMPMPIIGCINGASGGRLLFIPRVFATGRRMFDFRIDLAPDQDEEAGDVHPGEQHDHGADAAIGRIIRAEAIDIEGKTKGGQEPAERGIILADTPAQLFRF